MLIKRNAGYIAIILIALLSLQARAQDFRSPVDVPITLSGTFGEPRGSHFHSGIDIRTGGKEGLKVYAIEDGSVSRIKVSATGYGNAIYIDHPNGCTSVYGHLQRYSPRIDSFIKAIHYKKEQFEVDEYLNPGELTVKKGELIALSGNTGGSGGPHLHFEIRDTKTQIPVNPHLYKFSVTDNVAPGIHGLYIYPKNDSLEESVKVDVTERKANIYTTKQDTIWVNHSTISFGLHSTDRMNGSTSSNGIYSLKMQVDGKTVYSFTMDRFAFDETRNVQCHMDNAQKVANNNSVYRCYKLPGNWFERIYDSVVNNGYIKLTDKPVAMEFTVKDFEGNTSTLQTMVGYKEDSGFFKPKTTFGVQPIKFAADNTFADVGISLRFPPNTFYRDIDLHYERGPRIGIGEMSPLHHVHEETEAVRSRYTITLEPDTIFRPEKMLIARLEDDKEIETYTSTWAGLKLTAKPRELGVFFVTMDTTPPVIKPLNISEGKDMAGVSAIRITIKDNLTDIDTYRGTIDGTWVLFQYDKKNDLLFYEFDYHVPPGDHQLKLVVTDEVGNEQQYSCNFKK